jgi:predicted PurR-regulated permease PerM
VRHQLCRATLTSVAAPTLSQVGACCSAVLWLLDIHLSLLFGSIHFILNFIPNVGAIVATMLPVPLLLISPGVNVMQV